MTSGELLGKTTPLTEHVATHFRVLKPLVKDSAVNKKLLANLPETIKKLSQLDVSTFLETTFLDAKQITNHLGSSNIVRNGITFGLQTVKDENLLVRLYLPTGIRSEAVRDQINLTLSGGLAGVTRLFQGKSLKAQITEKPGRNTRYFSSAEIMIRTMAHMATDNKPFAQPLPTALIDTQGQPVGFTLAFDRLPTQPRDAEVEVTDTFFDWWGGETYGLAKSSREMAMGLYKALKGINSTPYVERGEKDLENMLLLDEAGEFVTFNRIGYSRNKISV